MKELSEELMTRVRELPHDTPQNFANAATKLLAEFSQRDYQPVRRAIVLEAYQYFPEAASEIDDAI
jgi:hypothetical protein